MAEALLRHKLQGHIPEITISSAGTSALKNYPADTLAQQILLEKRDIDISAHRARQVTLELLLQSDLILVMESSHQKQIECDFPSICGRVHRLGKWSGYDIPDPYKRPTEAFEQTLILIEQCINDWHTRLWK
jgi:protein-tyrosine phosphatase